MHMGGGELVGIIGKLALNGRRVFTVLYPLGARSCFGSEKV